MILDSGNVEIRHIVSEQPVVMAWSKKIPCHISTSVHNNEGRYKDGKFTVANYMVFMDMSYRPELPNNQIFRVKLTSNNGEDLGEFQVQKVEYLEVRSRIKIVV